MIEGNPRFETTCWSVVLAAGEDSSRAHDALSALCPTYWPPLYAFIRRWGYSPDDAADLTQSFLADLLARGNIREVDPARGRFRTFLMACCRHFLCNDRRRSARRGPSPLSIDLEDAERRYLAEPADLLTPEQVFDRRWALSILARALDSIREEYDRTGRGPLYLLLQPTLAGEPVPGGLSSVAEAMGMSEGAVQVAAHRLRRRYREAIRGLITETVEDPSQVVDEIRDLFNALAPPISRSVL
jgi:RNA polymerase sigma-70 factor (ECF subfamily)